MCAYVYICTYVVLVQVHTHMRVYLYTSSYKYGHVCGRASTIHMYVSTCIYEILST